MKDEFFITNNSLENVEYIHNNSFELLNYTNNFFESTKILPMKLIYKMLSAVWKVQKDGKTYALKIVNFL
jgi:hypothetical protein